MTGSYHHGNPKPFEQLRRHDQSRERDGVRVHRDLMNEAGETKERNIAPGCSVQD